jgi:hypothetical protein
MFSVCVYVWVILCLCIGRGLATSWSPAQGVLPTVLRSRKPKWNWEFHGGRPRPNWGCSAKEKNIQSLTILCGSRRNDLRGWQAGCETNFSMLKYPVAEWGQKVYSLYITTHCPICGYLVFNQHAACQVTGRQVSPISHWQE